jgi:hypothetical protein
MRKAKVKRYEIGGDVDYARNENREGRESTLDPSDREDAERGRRMTGTFGKVEYSPNFETSPVRSEYDAQSGLDYAPGMGSRKPIAAAKPRPKPPIPAAPARPMPPMSAGPAPVKPAPVKPAPAATAAPARVGRAGQASAEADVVRPSASTTRKNKERESEGFLSRLKRGLTGGGYEFEGGGREFGRKAGGAINYKKGGSVGSASKRADGIAIRGKTRGKMI